MNLTLHLNHSFVGVAFVGMLLVRRPWRTRFFGGMCIPRDAISNVVLVFPTCFKVCLYDTAGECSTTNAISGVFGALMNQTKSARSRGMGRTGSYEPQLL